MKKKATALVTLVAAASLAGATSVSAHAYPSLTSHHDAGHQASKVASVRLHALLETPDTAEHGATIRPNDWGLGAH
jgi:hypothetical protein